MKDNKNIDEDINIDTQNLKFILEPCKIPDFVDIKILKEYVNKDLDGNKEYFDDLDITYKISEPRKAEWILSKAIKNSKLVGNGNANIDIIVTDKIVIDVSVLTLNSNYTNEKSIIQNFKKCTNLDTLFNTYNGEEAVEIFKNEFILKYNFKDKEKEIYYIIFICKDKNIYISCLKLNPKNIINMKFLKFIKGQTENSVNILIGNFIDKNIGNVKLYKSKKRLELRLCKDILHHECSIKLF